MTCYGALAEISSWEWWLPPSRSPEELPALPAPPPSE